MGSRTRLRATAFWETLVYLINGVLFLLLGLQIRQILQASDLRLADMIGACAAAIVATVLIRFAWIAAFVRRANQVPLGRGERIVLGWAGMRGVLSVATALALPLALPGGEPFPARPILVLAAFSVVVATLVVQGLSLPALIKRLGLVSDDGFDAEEQGARLVALQAASARLAELTRAASGAEAEAARELQRRLQMALSRAGDGLGPASVSRKFDAAFSVLQRQIIEAERGALLQLWRAGRIDDHSLRRIERDLDLRELRL